jgi:hypothetical protein
MLTWIRLAWRMNRIELTLLCAAALFVTIALIWLGWQAQAIIGTDPTCFYHGDPGFVPRESPACQALNLLFGEQMAWEQSLNLGLAATVAPFVLGTLLGAPIVAREIEHRTASIAWSLSRSRTVWLAQRVVPIALFLVSALVLIGLAGSWFDDARFSTGFWREYGPWLLLVARGLLTFVLGVVSGTLVGRVLPAVLITVLACAVFLPISAVMERWMEAEAKPVAQTDLDRTVGSRSFGTFYRDDATDELISMNTYYGASDGQAVMGADQPPGMTLVDLAVPASRYTEFALRESALIVGLASVVGGAGILLVRRRRPY